MGSPFLKILPKQESAGIHSNWSKRLVGRRRNIAIRFGKSYSAKDRNSPNQIERDGELIAMRDPDANFMRRFDTPEHEFHLAESAASRCCNKTGDLSQRFVDHTAGSYPTEPVISMPYEKPTKRKASSWVETSHNGERNLQPFSDSPPSTVSVCLDL